MNSHNVLAIKWRLLVPISIKDGTFKQDGAKEMIHDKKLVNRHFASQRNEIQNNEFYEFLEEETTELMKIREGNILKNAETRKKESLGISDLATAVIELAKPKVKAVVELAEPKGKAVVELPEGEPNEDWNKAQLILFCEENDIEHKKTFGAEKLLELIKS